MIGAALAPWACSRSSTSSRSCPARPLGRGRSCRGARRRAPARARRVGGRGRPAPLAAAVLASTSRSTCWSGIAPPGAGRRGGSARRRRHGLARGRPDHAGRPAQLHLAALPAAASVHGRRVRPLPASGDAGSRASSGEFGWLDTPFHRWVYNLSLAVTFAARRARRRRALAAGGPRCAGGWPELLTYAALVFGILLVSIGVLGHPLPAEHRLRASSRRATCCRSSRSTGPALRRGGDRRRPPLRTAGRRLARGARCGHGLFAQLLVISRFYG